MTIFFPDISSYEHGLAIQPGTVAVIAKATEGTYYRDADYAAFKAQAAQVGAIFSAYHFLKAGDGAGQADYCHAMVGSTPVMLDVETESTSKPTVADCAAFIARMQQLDGRVWGAYFPQWYWQQVGGNLASLGVAIVASNYVAYSDTGPGWTPYGGATPALWQYTDAQSYGGQRMDFNAFKGSVQQLAALINGTTAADPSPSPSSTEDDMSFATGVIAPGLNQTTVILPPPANAGSAGWGNVWFSLGSDMGDAHVRITLFQNGAWRDFNLNYVVPAAKARVQPFDGPLPTDVEKISITRLVGSENVPLAYLIEAVKK